MEVKRVSKIFSVSIFIKLVGVFLLIIMPLFIFNLIVNIWAAGVVKQQISKTIIHQMDSYLSNFENEIKRIVSMAGLYTADRDVYFFSRFAEDMPENERLSIMKDIKERLDFLVRADVFVEDAYLYLPRMNMVFGSGGHFSEIVEKDINRLTENRKYPLSAYNGELYIIIDEFLSSSSATPSSQIPALNKKILVSVKLNNSYIEKYLFNISQDENSYSILVDRDFRWSLPSETERVLKDRIIYQNGDMNNYNTSHVFVINSEKGGYLTFITRSEYLDALFYTAIPENALLSPYLQYSKFLWVMLILIVIAIVTFSYSLYNMIERPLIKFASAFRQVEENNLDVSISREQKDEFGYLYTQFNKMVSTLKQSIDRLYRQTILTQKAELQQLQFQINPHFLHNSIYLIYRLAESGDFECIKKFTMHLSSYYKYATHNNPENITLQEELSHARDYAEIQGIRFRNRMYTEFDEIPESFSAISVPRLIVQPVIENAYKHGLADKINGGLVKVSVKNGKGNAQIFIEDNGESLDDARLKRMQEYLMSENKDKDISGLLNVHMRLKMRCGPGSGVFISRSSLGGARIELRITTQEGKEDV